jgi:nucleotide-binding universal stress UspA family protein
VVNGQRPTVVVGVDPSAESHAALRWAVEHARRSAGRVVAIAVSELRPLLAPGAGLAGGGAGAAAVAGTVPGVPLGAAGDGNVTDEADLWLAEAVARLPDGTAEAVDRRVERGDPAQVLLEAARDADLLVLGNHGRGALGGALVGSVAQHCVRHAAGPLVLVPAAEPARPRTASSADEDR